MADLKTTNIFGDAYINNKVGIATNAPATRLQIGQLSPTAATEGLQFGDDTGARLYRGGSSYIQASAGFQAGAQIYASTYLQSGNSQMYPGSYTSTQRFGIGNASGNAWIDGLTIAQGGNVTVYNNLTVNNAATVTNDLTVNGNTYLGNANNDTVYVNDTIRIGATDSGDASLFFGEGSVAGSDYGARWYWDSGYTFTWYTRNNGTDTALFDYVTNDLNYINWRRNFHMQNKEINYNAQVHFNAGTRFVGNSTQYLNFRSDATTAGGILIQDGSATTKGYTGYWDSAGGGILNDTGNWAVRYNFGNANSGGTLYGAWTINGNISATNLSGTNTGDQSIGNGTITIAAGTGIGVGTTNTFTMNQSGATTVTVTNNGVTSLTTNTGLSSNVSATGAVTVTNTGVTSNVAGTGISVSGATGAVTITNSGVTSAVAGTGISVSGATGAVTITNSGVTSLAGTTNRITVSAGTGGVTLNLPQDIHTGASPTFSGLSLTSVSTTGATITNLTGAYQNTTVYDSPRTQSATPSRGIRAPASSIQFTDSYAIAPFYTYRSTGDWPVPYGIGWGTGGESSGIFQRYASNGSSFGDMIFYTGNDGFGAFSFRRHTWEGTTYFAAGSGELNTELFRVDWAGKATAISFGLTGGFVIDATGAYGQFNNWVHLPGYHGFYSSNNGAHIYPNNGSYGSWRISGTRNSWYGLEFDSGVCLMMNSNEVGFYRIGSGWQMRWTAGTGYVYKGNPGGGTEATILDSSNYTSYTPGLGTNNTLTGINVINNTSNTLINNQSGNLGLTMFQATAGTDAYMTFHIGSDYAAYFGLGGAENDLVYGGWSAGNNRHRILHSGNATYAWNMNQYVRTTDSPTFNTVTANITGNAYNNLSNDYKDIYVYGDVNTYYVVLIQGDYLYSFGRYSVTRGYNWAGPDTWYNATHRGGLTLDWEWSGDTAWGGNDKAIRIIEFNESYSTMVAGLGYPVNGGVIIWLRGGGVNGALYRIRTPVGSNATVTVYDNLSIANHVASTTFTAADSTVFSTRANTNNVSAEILARYPVRGAALLYNENNAVLHAGNYNSYSPTLTGTGASGTWSINVTGNAATATTLQTARNINGTSFNGSAAITTATWGTARTLTIGSTGKSVDGSAAITWSLAEIGAAATNGASNQNFSANSIYPYEWIRFMVDAGIYWQSGTYAGWHIHPQADWGMSFRSAAATDCGLQLRRSDATSLGAVYSDGTSIGFLTAAFGWGASFTVAGTMNRGTVPLGRIETITAYTILGNNNASAAAVPSALTPAQVATMLSGQTMNIAGSSTSCSGNAATATTATTLQTARAINGVSFNGSAAITVNGLNYNVNNDWLRENGDDDQFKLYGNSRTMIYRTDGNTNAHGGGAFAHIFYYGGSADGNRMFIINTDGRLWSTYHGWLDTLNTTGNAGNVTIGNLASQLTTTSTLPAGAWYTVAVNSGDRASAKFTITNEDSGLHQAVQFYATAHYGTETGAKISVVSNTYYSGPPIGNIRIMRGSTYDGAMLQVYTNNTCSIKISIYDNQQSGGWVIKNGVVSTSNPGGVSNYAALTTVAAQVELNSGKSFSVSDELYIGGATTQYKALHANNYTDYTVTKTGGGASGNWGINVTGNAATATTTDNINGRAFYNRDSGNALGQDAYTNNGIGYVNSVSLYSQTDGGMYAAAYSTSWIHQIYGDFRTGQIAIRGKNSGTWQSWRTVLDATNSPYAYNMNQYVRTTDTCSFAAVTATTFTGALSGNATSATSATSATFLNSSNYINRCGSSGNANTDFQNTPAGSVRHNGDDANLTNSPGGTWWFYDNYRHSNNSNYWGIQVAWGWEDQLNKLATRNISGGSFGGWVYYLNSGNYTDYTVTKTGTGASGTWGINVTGNAVTVGGLAVHGGTNNEANKVVRTDGNGYINAGWINTPSGDMPDTQSINRIYCSDDQFIRYKGVADFKQQIGLTYKNATPRSANTTDTNYWTGIMGWTGTDWNSMSDWGCGFVDSWDSPANRPPVGTHHVGIQALHYTNGTARYGWQMANGTGNNRWWLRDVWGGSFSTWFEILTSTNYTSFAPSLTGTGASGTWSINITGNAGGSSTSCSGNAATATLATKASTLSQGGGTGTGMTFNWSGQGGQPTWLWGSNDGTNIYVWNPSNFNVNYATSAGSANALTTGNTYQVANLGIGVAASNRLHVDGGSPAAGTAGIRIDNAGYLTGVASNNKATFYGYLPLKVSATVTVYIRLWQ